MKAFITGGTGFIGQAVVRKLKARGWDVYALVRSQTGAARMMALGAQPVWGDINATESMRQAMRGCEAVFHLAAWYKLGDPSWRKAELINVEGTRNVLTLAQDLGVPRIIYVSSMAVFSNTRGIVPDETYLPDPGRFLNIYEHTKYLAHYRVALPLIQQGAPITIVMPGAVYGPGDSSVLGDLMRLYYRGWLPVLPGPKFTLSYVYVDDVAEGIILAYEKGRPGQSYLLTGPIASLRQVSQIWARLTGKLPPLAYIPVQLLSPLASLTGWLERYIHIPAILSQDAITFLGSSYTGNPAKAYRELGWHNRSLEDGFRETFAWIAEQERIRPRIWKRLSSLERRQTAALVGAMLGFSMALWYWRRKA